MSVVLLILKILGITILAFLGLVLLIVLLVLFVPLRYQVAWKGDKEHVIRLQASWLLHLIHVSGRYENKEMTAELRILGFIRKPIDLEKKEKQEEKPEEKEEEKPKEKEKKDFETVLQDVENALTVAEDPRTGRAVSKAWKTLKKLLRAILPKDLTGSVHYGFREPDKTGKMTAFLASVLRSDPRKLKVRADFEQAVFEADLKAKGRIFLIQIVVYAVGLILDRDVRYLIAALKKKSGKEKEDKASG